MMDSRFRFEGFRSRIKTPTVHTKSSKYSKKGSIIHIKSLGGLGVKQVLLQPFN